jgi:hypothetical protein
MEPMARVKSGKIESLPNSEARAEAVATVDAMLLACMNQTHIGLSSILYSRCCSSYYATGDS